MDYTERVDGFQIRDLTYFFPRKERETRIKNFDIVKWQSFDTPHKTFAYNDKTKKFEDTMVDESCYSIATLDWNEKEDDFELNPVGLRIFTSGLTQAAMDMIVRFAKEKAKELQSDD